MDEVYKRLFNSLKHLEILHDIFRSEESFGSGDEIDKSLYAENETGLGESLHELGLYDELYGEKGRQMILADLLEYVFLGRGYLAVRTKEHRKRFIKAIMHFVNLPMCYETMTVSEKLRRRYLDALGEEIPSTQVESGNAELKHFEGSVGLKRGEADAPEHLNKYFDTILPKTAGGLWHELLVYVFLVRNNCGYVIPLVLSQRLLGFENHVVPPDFLILAKDKRIYGIEVGRKKEIQSGSFSLRTAIPTATLDTENSRTSDRCPICKRWIAFCPFVISKYSDLDEPIARQEVKCLVDCDIYTVDEVASGLCNYTKYSRNRADTMEHTHHEFSNNLHYHYTCVLNSVSEETRGRIITAQDRVALKTHFPYYAGIEELMKQGVSDEAAPEDV